MTRSLACCAVVLALGLAACGDDGGKHTGTDAGSGSGSGTATLTVSPPDLHVTVLNGIAVAQEYTAALTDGNGNTTDVTQQATFTLADPTYGTFYGPALSINGQGAGPVTVMATLNGVSGTATLTVAVKVVRLEGSATTQTATDFGSATETTSIAHTFV